MTDEITALTDTWYRLIGPDHHKDRDCHFYVEKVWSYGDPPYYRAYHHGYVADYWQSPKCSTAAAAEGALITFLKKIIADEQKWQAENVE